jgi:ABC-type transport system substrate-binding protein
VELSGTALVSPVGCDRSLGTQLLDVRDLDVSIFADSAPQIFALEGKAAEISAKQTWFREVGFREAISSAIDREAMNRIVYLGRGAPLWTLVTPGNRIWFDSSIPRPALP